MLMENKVNVNQVHNLKGSHFEGFTLYHFAVLSKTVDMIKYLLENKVLLGLEVYINQRNAVTIIHCLPFVNCYSISKEIQPDSLQ